MRVLVVDDSAMMRRMIIKALNGLGYMDCGQAGTGKEALEMLTQSGADLVLTDWNMPEMNGLDFVKAMRANAAMSKVPVLMVTTNVGPAELVAATEAGISGCVSKPFTPQVLQDQITKALQA